MSLITAHLPSPQGDSIHLGLNRCQLVRKLFALPAVRRYSFATGCDQALLLRADPDLWPQRLGPSLIDLEGQLGDPALLLALPLAWSRGLMQLAEAPPLQALLEAGATPLALDAWPELELFEQPQPQLLPSALVLLLAPYRALLAAAEPLEPVAALQLLQLERQLRRQLAAGCWPAPASLGRPLPLARWLDSPPAEAAALQRLSDQLVALLHLLPAAEQPAYAHSLQALLLAGLEQAEPQPWLRLLEALVGGINSRQSELVAVAADLRRAGLERGAALDDPGERGLALMRLLQAPLAEERPGWLAVLAGAIDALVLAIGVAAEAGEREQKRALQRQLEAIVLSGSTNLPLLQALLPQLAPETGYRLPSLLPPAACLVLVKGVLLLGDPAIARLDRPWRRALLALLERGLPRLWWQADLLQKLLHDLRRFPLHTTWLQADNAELLPALVQLHSRGVAPPPPNNGPEPLQLRPLAPEELPGEPEDPRRLQRLPLQLQAQGMGEVVVVVNRQGLARHLLDRQVAAGVLALVALLAQQPQRQIQLSGALLQQRCQRSRLGLRRAVVDHQHLQHRHALQGHRFQGLAQQLQPRPVAGKQHRDRQSDSLRRHRQHLAPLGQAGGKHGLHAAGKGQQQRQ